MHNKKHALVTEMADLQAELARFEAELAGSIGNVSTAICVPASRMSEVLVFEVVCKCLTKCVKKLKAKGHSEWCFLSP